MKKISIMIAAALLAFSVTAGAQTLDELAEIVRQAANSEGKINKDREAQFLAERDNQRNLLAQAKAEKKREEKRSDDLKSEYDRLERELADFQSNDRPHRRHDQPVCEIGPGIFRD